MKMHHRKRGLLLAFSIMALALAIPLLGQPKLTVGQLYQTDYTNNYDKTTNTIKDVGCSLTAFAMLVNYEMQQQGLHAANGVDPLTFSPADLNQILNDYKTDKNGHAAQGWLDDGKGGVLINGGGLIDAVYQESKKRSKEGVGLQLDTANLASHDLGPNGQTVDEKTAAIFDSLQAGHPVIARVDGNSHTVLITGWDGASKQYIVNDTLRAADGGQAGLSGYGNKVYGYDIYKFKKGGLPIAYTAPSPYYFPPSLIYDPNANPGQYAPEVSDGNAYPTMADGFFQLLSLTGAMETPGCAPGKNYVVTARWQNTSANQIQEVFASVAKLTNGNQLLSGFHMAPGAVVPPSGTITATFKIQMAACTPFQFFVHLWGYLLLN